MARVIFSKVQIMTHSVPAMVSSGYENSALWLIMHCSLWGKM